MATSDFEPAPEPVAGQQSSPPPPAAPRRGWRSLGLGLVLVSVAAILGLVLGVSVVLRGQSLGSATAGTAARPTFIIGAVPSRPPPSPSPSPAVSNAPAGSVESVEYVVQPGDTLRGIAQTLYGDADQWLRIYDANRDLIGSNPDALKAGTRLQIPGPS